MPTGCQIVEKSAHHRLPDGRWALTRLPWCVEHGRWFAACQCRMSLAVSVDLEQLPPNVVDINSRRIKRT